MVSRHRLGRADDAHHDVAVVEERDPAADRVAVRLDPGRVDQAVVVIAVVGLLEPDLAPAASILWVRVGGTTW